MRNELTSAERSEKIKALRDSIKAIQRVANRQPGLMWAYMEIVASLAFQHDELSKEEGRYRTNQSLKHLSGFQVKNSGERGGNMP